MYGSSLLKDIILQVALYEADILFTHAPGKQLLIWMVGWICLISKFQHVLSHYIPTYQNIRIHQSRRLGLENGIKGGMAQPGVGVALKPMEKGMIFSQEEGGYIGLMGPGDNTPEYIDKKHYPWTQKIKCIEEFAWSVGMGRRIYKRADTGQWDKVDAGLILPT